MAQTHKGLIAASGLLALVLVAACQDSRTPTAVNRPNFWGGGGNQCPITKFTGGGRIDSPPANSLSGKVTFGFNIFVDQNCNVLKGELQVVHHPTQSKYHSHLNPSETTASADDACATAGFQGGLRFSGIVSVKHGNGPWHDEPFTVRVCDNGEPGSQQPGISSKGPDTFRFQDFADVTPGHGDTGNATGDTPLTGGNIQAH